jgi:hypothetical protein
MPFTHVLRRLGSIYKNIEQIYLSLEALISFLIIKYLFYFVRFHRSYLFPEVALSSHAIFLRRSVPIQETIKPLDPRRKEKKMEPDEQKKRYEMPPFFEGSPEYIKAKTDDEVREKAIEEAMNDDIIKSKGADKKDGDKKGDKKKGGDSSKK